MLLNTNCLLRNPEGTNTKLSRTAHAKQNSGMQLGRWRSTTRTTTKSTDIINRLKTNDELRRRLVIGEDEKSLTRLLWAEDASMRTTTSQQQNKLCKWWEHASWRSWRTPEQGNPERCCFTGGNGVHKGIWDIFWTMSFHAHQKTCQ